MRLPPITDLSNIILTTFNNHVSFLEDAHVPLQMPRLQKDTEVQWKAMDEELRQAYGKRYVDGGEDKLRL